MRDPLPRPAGQRRREGVLERLLGEIEIAEETDQGGQDPARLAPVELADQLGNRNRYVSNSTTGRTSIVPSRAEGIREATWMASFRSLASMR